jgi:hypothetical protein
MPKRSTVRKERFANRYRGTLTFGADASVYQHDTFNTGMNVGQSSAFAWTILGVTIGPNDYTDIDEAANSGAFIAQLAIGAQDAIIDQDDMQAVSTKTMHASAAAGSSFFYEFPLVFPILSPIPVFAQQLTIGMQATNVALFNSDTWAYEIVYVQTPVSQQDIVEYLAAFGQV